MGSFLAELRRRHIFRIGAGYVVVAWAITQVLDVLSQLFALPNWIAQPTVVMLAIGFPVVLIATWMIVGAANAPDGTTGHLRATRTDWALASGLVIVLLVIGYQQATRQSSSVVGLDAVEMSSEAAGSPGQDLIGSTIQRRTTTSNVSRTTIGLPAGLQLAPGENPPIAISPDGRQIVITAEGDDGTSHFYVRPLNQFEAVQLPNTENAIRPFFSPDGQWIGFWANRGLFKIAVEGGAPIKISDLALAYRGASWGNDGFIILGGSNTGLYRVSADGGTPIAITTTNAENNEDYHAWPQLLPGNREVLFTIHRTTPGQDSEIGLLSLNTGEWRRIEGTQGGAQPKFISSGHLVFARTTGQSGSLFAMPFDLANLVPVSPPELAIDGVHIRRNAGLYLSDFDLSQAGALVYAFGELSPNEIVVTNREDGSVLSLAETADSYGLNLSPDGMRLAYTSTAAGPSDIWVLDLTRQTRTRLTTTGTNISPLWTIDGSQIAAASFVGQSFDIYSIPADQSADAQPLLIREHSQFPDSWSPDGQLLAFEEVHPNTGTDILILDTASSEVTPFLVTDFNELDARFSPDGSWIAYASDESGQYEIYVRPFPGPGPRIAVSIEGGERPIWSKDGTELFFRRGNQMFRSEIDVRGATSLSVPTPLFAIPYAQGTAFDVSADGNEFFMLRGNQRRLIELNLVSGWPEELN